MGQIKVLVSGCCGKMGCEVVKAVLKDSELKLVAAVDKSNVGKDIGTTVGSESLGVVIMSDLQEAIMVTKPDVMIDFTTPMTVFENVITAVKAGVHAVVGTTGISQDNLAKLTELSKEYKANVLIAPNFAIGALLMMRFSEMAAKFFPNVEIIELHHDQKLDAPSGTSIKTAEMILAARGEVTSNPNEEEKIKGVRGGEMGGIHLHSIRLPGLIAHQEVIFGGEGQTLTIRHDSLSRESFMPGVVLAAKKIIFRPGLTYGLEHLLFEA